jgi:DNA-binding MarR family transcriptional regulator
MTDAEYLSSAFGRTFLRLHRLMDRRMADQGASFARTKLLLYIGHQGPTRAADIADFFGHAPRTVTEAIDGLERDGLVRREPDKLDRRAKRVLLTDAGRAAAAATEPVRARLIAQVFGPLSETEREQLSAIIAKLATAIEAQEDAAALPPLACR